LTKLLYTGLSDELPSSQRLTIALSKNQTQIVKSLFQLLFCQAIKMQPI
jgi:hypothetical protein